MWQKVIIALSVIWLIGSIDYYGMHKRFLKDGGDAWGYYIYLPSVFISNDISSLKYVSAKREEFSPHTINKSINHLGYGEVYIAPNGNPVIKYTSGVAIMLSPFFLIAHGLSYLTGNPTTGFTDIYWWSMYLGVLVWVLAGMFFLYKILIRYFSPVISFITLIAILLGTNLYYFIVYNAGMAHASLFSLYCFLIYFTDQFHKTGKKRDAVAIGLICGLITMIRPVELICVLIPILWGIKSIKHQVSYLWDKRIALLLAAFFFAMAVMPQLIYWKTVSGHWLYYSYGEEGFNFLKPQIWKGLTSFMNGWFIYTPLMLFIIPGFILLFRKFRAQFWPIFCFTLLHIYIVYSWHNWYYINSFGSRPMVETYTLMAFPLIAFFSAAKQDWLKWILGGIVLIFVLLNQHQTWQVSQAIMLSEDGSKAYYRSILGLNSMNEKALIAADSQEFQPDSAKLQNLGTIATFPIEASGSIYYIDAEQLSTVIISDTFARIDLPVENNDIRPGDYLKISTQVWSTGWNNDRWRMGTITTSFDRGGKYYKWKWTRINNKLGNPTWNLWGGTPDIWGTAWYFVKVPSKYQSGDRIMVWCENNHPAALIIKEFKVELWRGKR